MSHPLTSRAVAGGLLSLLVLAGGAPGAQARPTPGDAGPVVTIDQGPDCGLRRVDRQLVRCDNLTGAGVPAPLFIPELSPLGPDLGR